MIFNVQRYSVQDGPGIRTAVFLKGCPLQCAWCHNPEGICHERELLIVETRCLACGACRSACPFGSQEAGISPLNPRDERCVFCGECVEACPSGARRMVGREVTVAELMEEILRDRMFYEESGGGVTFSGGEPLAQPEFLLAMLRACRENGLHAAVDTCGLVPTRHLAAIAPFTDLFLYDLKLMNDARHQECTGASNRLILENLRTLGQIHERIWIRVPVIPGVNDAAPDLQATAAFALSLPSVRQVNLLPYHRNGAAKLRRLGQESALVAVTTPSPERMAETRRVFESAGLKTLIGG